MSRFFLSILFISAILNSYSQIPGLSQIIKKVDPAIIKIYTINSSNEYESQGSGVIISNNGICISNYHVLLGAKKAIAITASGKKFDVVKILDYSKENDLIKFKIEIGSQVTTSVTMNNLLPQKGEDVFAVGYPNGFNIQGESTLSTGIISGIREENGEKIIQTSTPFTHGSSGGGLFDASGKLLGITSGTFAEEVKDRHANLNKVIPVYLVNKLTRNLNLTLISFYESVKNNENFIQGMIAYEILDFPNAAEYFIAHLDEYPEDATAWFRLGNSFHQLGRSSGNKELLNDALECFEISISLDTNYYHPWGQAALVYSILGNIPFAKSYAYSAYQIDPNISFTNYVIGKVANEAKEYNLAVEFLGYAIEMANDNDKANFVHQWYLEKAIANAWLNKDYDAEQDYKKCLSLNSRNLDALFWFGNFLALRNRYSESCIQFNKLKILNPDYSMAGYSVDEMIQLNKCSSNYFKVPNSNYKYLKNSESVQIDQITSSGGFLVVQITGFPSKQFSSGWWINFSPNAYVEQNGKKYFLQKAEGIPLSPQKHYFSNINVSLTFKLYFENSINLNNAFDLIEIEGSGTAFNFYNISK